MPFAFGDSCVNCLKIAHMSDTYPPDASAKMGRIAAAGGPKLPVVVSRVLPWININCLPDL